MTTSVVGAIAPKLSKPRSSAPSASRPKISMRTTITCAESLTFIAEQEAIGEALRLFCKAIELDPDFASAYRHGRVVSSLAQGQWME